MDDLIGWASFTRAEIERVTVKMLLQVLEPPHLNLTETPPLKYAWETLKACGMSELGIVERLAHDASIPWTYEYKPGQHYLRAGIWSKDVCTGHISGRLKPHHETAWALEWAYKIPVPGQGAVENASYIGLQRSPDDGDTVRDAKIRLSSIYFQTLGDIINE
jgi:hypothetical protein